MPEHTQDKAYIVTVRERCRSCYMCVRECPAKAIRIAEGQAEVIAARCIGCGNCVRVCSQNAKRVRTTLDEVTDLLTGEAPVAACLAPSFPAAFPRYDHRQLVGMVRMLGFDFVQEVAFGADLISNRYRTLLQEAGDKRFIGTNCPAIVSFVERYHPELLDSLAPIVSPMIATARLLRRIHGDNLKVVFIGPCTAKKCEANEPGLNAEVDAAITFFELRQLFRRKRISPMSPVPSEFDPPRGSLGALYGISRGFLQSAGLPEDLVTGDVIAADGRESFVQALKEFEAGAIEAKLLEVLACQGCIMGPGMDTEAPMFSRRALVSDYVRERRKGFDEAQWEKDIAQFDDLDLCRTFQAQDQRIPTPSPGRLAEILTRMGKFRLEDELNCGACGYDTCREHAIAIYKGLAEVTMCLPHTIEQLGETVRELGRSNDQLARTQEALVQSEKLASMGQLAAGIAHELNNPLAVVLMYSHLLMDEVNEDGSKLHDDLGMIVRQAERCRKIVSGLLNFARQNRVSIQKTDLRELVEEAVRVSVIPDEINIRVKHEGAESSVDLDHDQVMQVIINLISNACAAMPSGGTLTLRTYDETEDRKAFSVGDTGTGISKDNLTRIFDPFFTTKDVGKGTGLGLAIAYGIVKMHRGDIRVESNADSANGPTGTTFCVALPRRAEHTE